VPASAAARLEARTRALARVDLDIVGVPSKVRADGDAS
jgi:hypothetical protein